MRPIIIKMCTLQKKPEIKEIKKTLLSLKEYKKLKDYESNPFKGEITFDGCTDVIF